MYRSSAAPDPPAARLAPPPRRREPCRYLCLVHLPRPYCRPRLVRPSLPGRPTRSPSAAFVAVNVGPSGPGPAGPRREAPAPRSFSRGARSAEERPFGPRPLCGPVPWPARCGPVPWPARCGPVPWPGPRGPVPWPESPGAPRQGPESSRSDPLMRAPLPGFPPLPRPRAMPSWPHPSEPRPAPARRPSGPSGGQPESVPRGAGRPGPPRAGPDRGSCPDDVVIAAEINASIPKIASIRG